MLNTLNDFYALNKQLKEKGIKAPRSAKNAHRLHKERQSKRFYLDADFSGNPPIVRYENMLTERYKAVIALRGGEIGIVTANNGTGVDLDLVDRKNGFYLLHVSAWRYYSRTYQSQAHYSYICGTDDSGKWAVRIPGTITTIKEGLNYLEPATVKKAKANGKKVIRQGDVYCIETTKAHDGKGELPPNHEFDKESRVLTHNEHVPVKIDFPCRFVRQKALAMGITSSSGYAD